MYPIYGHRDSYPHQMPYAPYNPNLESIPYQMKPDLPKSPLPYEYGPYGINNYYHPHPMEFHSCCNHNYFPSCYTFRPPYPHFPPSPPPQQPFHCHYTPRPHYPMELPPRYDYDKIAPRDHHCCGCPNHSCARKDDQIVKIEEPDPDAEKKTSDSLVPHQLKNYPYPVVWIPPSYLRNKEDVKGIPVEERKENSKSFEEESRFLNGWLPLDMNKLGSLMQGEDGRKVENQKNDEEGRFPFSIFRVPYNPEELERNGPAENKVPSHFSITPVDALDTEDSKSKSLLRVSEGDSDSVRMIIPEKKEKNVEKKTEKENEGKAKNIPVEFRMDNVERKIVKNREKRRSSSSSPPKSSKLPPVCLRVDPLPRKKSSSRSPSPPANKCKSEKSTSENSKNSVEENCPENMQSSKPVEKSKERKVIEVVENDSKNGKTKGKNVVLGRKCEVGEGKVESEIIKEKADKEENKVRRKILSGDEAAMIIQSVYRGYEVRKWEPLIKLKQIAKVKDQATEVKRSIEGLDSSSLADVQSDDKQRLAIGETIMSLLLKLDAIQGLHPSIRDIRKSVARELVSLQEKLDALTTKKPNEDLSATTATSEAVENMEPMLVDKEKCGDLENKSTESPAANEEANVEEQKDKVLDTENHEDSELEQSNEITTHPLVTQDNACSDELLKEMPPSGEEENDEKLLEKAQGEEFNHADEAAVVEDINGKAEEATVQPLEDEAMKADGVILPLKADEQKPEHSCVEEENDEKVLEEAKLGTEVQPEEAQQKEVDIADESAVVAEEEITGKTEEFVVQPLEAEAEEPQLKLAYIEDKVKNADDIVQVVEAEEPQPKDANDIVQTVEAEEPQPKLPCVESEASTEELTETHVIKEDNGESSELGDGELAVDNIIVQPNGDTEEFVPQECEEKLREENEKLKEMVKKLVEAGKEQLSAISSLSGKVKDLERKLSKKKKLKMRKCVKKSRTLDNQMVC